MFERPVYRCGPWTVAARCRRTATGWRSAGALLSGARTRETTVTSQPVRKVSWRRLGGSLALVGVLTLSWAALTYFWQEPFGGIYARLQQDRLSEVYERRASQGADDAAPAAPPQPATDREARSGTEAVGSTNAGSQRRQLAELARAYRESAKPGEPIGRIAIPRLDIDLVIVNGTSIADLRRGPGRDPRAYMPGEGELVYIAGHRTTWGAPFRYIDRLQPGDRVYVEVPYGRFEYRVTGNEVVYPDQIEKLRSRGREELSIQASHPPYSARQRLIVHARLVAVQPTAKPQ